MIEGGYDHIATFAQQRRRTNNDMESYHRNLRDTMNTAHLNVWIVQGAEECEISVQRCPNTKINTLTTRLDGGQYSVPEFLEAASHQLDNIHNVPGDDKDDVEDVFGVDGVRLALDEEVGSSAAVAVRERGRGGVVASCGRCENGSNFNETRYGIQMKQCSTSGTSSTTITTSGTSSTTITTSGTSSTTTSTSGTPSTTTSTSGTPRTTTSTSGTPSTTTSTSGTPSTTTITSGTSRIMSVL
ncbi:hypothetical protein J6590_049756 [Homalodisca vitripennis]|nr:hypothetical protein J6590_092074 [Homalodisca vitripennis]KAG8301603.1 hypothetical protein J6590_049756 [Homalodisca vitripennis]